MAVYLNTVKITKHESRRHWGLHYWISLRFALLPRVVQSRKGPKLIWFNFYYRLNFHKDTISLPWQTNPSQRKDIALGEYAGLWDVKMYFKGKYTEGKKNAANWDKLLRLTEERKK